MDTKEQKTRSRTLMGTVYILTSAFLFAWMTLFVRLSGDLPVMQKSLFRNLIALGVAAVVLRRSGHGFRLQPGTGPTMLLRCAFGTAGLIANYWALGHIPIADANMLNKLSPFFAIVMSIFILGERPGWVDILSIAAAFTGAVFVVRPSAGLASFPALVAACSGFFAGTAYTYLRKLGRMGEPGPVIVFYFSLFSCLTCVPFLLFRYEPMTLRQLLYLLGAGVSAAGAQLAVTAAYRSAPAKDISVYDYSQVIWSALLGIFILSEFPDRLSILGFAIILCAAVGRFLYNKYRHE